MLCILILVLGILGGCGSGSLKRPDTAAKWTILIYMNGSDLETASAAATRDLREMVYAGSNEEVNVVVQTGGSEHWHNVYVDAESSQRWYVKPFRLQELFRSAAVNMSSAETLSDFLIWGVEMYPAEKYALILWNHGGSAVAGFGVDEQFSHDTLLLAEMRTAFADAYAQTDVIFELVAFDACLMSNIETASIIAPYARYLAASEELMNDNGFAYDVFINTVKRNADEDGAYLGRVLVDTYVHKPLRSGIGYLLAVTDLEYISKIQKQIDEIVQEKDDAGRFVRKTYDDIAVGRMKSTAEQTNMLDLEKFFAEVFEADLAAVLNEAVVYRTDEALCGLSIYFPYRASENPAAEYAVYQSIGFSEVYLSAIEGWLYYGAESHDEGAQNDVTADLPQGVSEGYIGKITYDKGGNLLSVDSEVSYEIDGIPVTVYATEGEEALCFAALVNGRYCEFYAEEGDDKLVVVQAVPAIKSAQGAVCALKAFYPQSGDKIAPISIHYDGAEGKMAEVQEEIFQFEQTLTVDKSLPKAESGV